MCNRLFTLLLVSVLAWPTLVFVGCSHSPPPVPQLVEPLTPSTTGAFSDSTATQPQPVASPQVSASAVIDEVYAFHARVNHEQVPDIEVFAIANRLLDQIPANCNDEYVRGSILAFSQSLSIVGGRRSIARSPEWLNIARRTLESPCDLIRFEVTFAYKRSFWRAPQDSRRLFTDAISQEQDPDVLRQHWFGLNLIQRAVHGRDHVESHPPEMFPIINKVLDTNTLSMDERASLINYLKSKQW